MLLPHIDPHSLRTLGVLFIWGLISLVECWLLKRKNMESYQSDGTLANFWIIFVNANMTYALTGIVMFNYLTPIMGFISNS